MVAFNSYFGREAKLSDQRRAVFWIAMFLSLVGVVMIFATTYWASVLRHASPWSYVERQAMWIGLGWLAYAIFSRTTPSRLRGLAAIALLGTVGLLGAVLVPGIGSSIYGSSRWLGFGPIQIQPSELAKLALTLFLARFLSSRSQERSFRRVTLPTLLILGAMSLLVLAEPDMGTAVILGVIVFGILLGAGTKPHELILTFLGGGAAGIFFAFAQPYRRARMMSFMHPWVHRTNWSYQEVQALAGFASGHIAGVGLGAGQTNVGYLPNAQSDYIFAVIGQDLGFLGSVVLLLGYLALIVLLFRMSAKVKAPMDSLFCFGVACWFGGQAVLNVGAVEGLLPVTGVPLPLVSAGGSSTMVMLVALGLMQGAVKNSLRSPGLKTRAGSSEPLLSNSQARLSSVAAGSSSRGQSIAFRERGIREDLWRGR